LTRRTALVIGAVGIALGAILVGTQQMVARSRSSLVERFASDELRQVQEVAREIEDEVSDVAEDLRFAAQLLQTARSMADFERELRALLAVVKQYRVASVYNGAGERVLRVVDPRAASFEDNDVEKVLRETARRALARPAGEAPTAAPVIAEAGRWYRVFALPVPENLQGRAAVAVLVDTEPSLGHLRVVAAQPTARLLILGLQGRATAASEPTLKRLVGELDLHRTRLPRFASVIDDMQRGGRGTLHLGEREAIELGFAAAEVVASYVPIRIQGGGNWSVAKLSSTAILRSHEQAILLRLALAGGVMAACLLALGAYIVVTSRQAALVRERLKHAEQLGHLHEKTEKILDHIPTAVIALSDDKRITALNRAMREKVPGSAVGAGLSEAFPQAPAAVLSRLRALVEDARVRERVQSLHGERLALFGVEGQYSVHAVPLERGFPEARLLLVIEDLTEVSQLATQLLRAEKLATVGILAAGIAHEVGTPLSVVRGRAEYLREKLGADNPHVKGLSIIVEQIDHVTRSIAQLLDFSRLKAPAVRATSVAAVARAVVELLRFEADRRRVALHVEVAPDVPLLAADPDQLQQVLVNLVMNACDACIGGGRVTVSATAPKEGDVRVEVSDNGCGIPEENRHQVFDPFFTTKKRGQGTGLGLAVAAQIVRNHRARIELVSESGRGTRVTLMWPRAEPSRVELHDSIG
jgi:two-component system, NtrC family, sensor histidine kinase HydH